MTITHFCTPRATSHCYPLLHTAQYDWMIKDRLPNAVKIQVYFSEPPQVLPVGYKSQNRNLALISSLPAKPNREPFLPSTPLTEEREQPHSYPGPEPKPRSASELRVSELVGWACRQEGLLPQLNQGIQDEGVWIQQFNPEPPSLQPCKRLKETEQV